MTAAILGGVIVSWILGAVFVIRRYRRLGRFAQYDPDDATAIAIVLFLLWPLPPLAALWPSIGAPITGIGDWLRRSAHASLPPQSR